MLFKSQPRTTSYKLKDNTVVSTSVYHLHQGSADGYLLPSVPLESGRPPKTETVKILSESLWRNTNLITMETCPISGGRFLVLYPSLRQTLILLMKCVFVGVGYCLSCTRHLRRKGKTNPSGYEEKKKKK